MVASTERLSESLENYLETILLLAREHSVARARDISQRLGVSRSSVTGALQALGGLGLVNYEPYGLITLTPHGSALAAKVLWRHEALRRFLVSILGVDEAEADAAACRMEHGIPKSIVDRLLSLASFLETCPGAGTKWVRGGGHACRKTAPPAKTCEKCITECLEVAMNTMKKKGRGR
ncbi:MAG: metal-dependent transcriptional regulator [bacterium]